MAESPALRAEESVAAHFSRGMNAATSSWGVLTDFTVASSLAAIPVVLIVRQLGAKEIYSVTTYVLALLALSPLLAAVVVSIRLRHARAEVVAWLAAQPFAIDNVNALLVGLTDRVEIEFVDAGRMPTRIEMQRILEPLSDDILATDASPEDRRVDVQIGVIESKRVPLRSTYQRWMRFRKIVEEVLVPMSRERPIASVRLVLARSTPSPSSRRDRRFRDHLHLQGGLPLQSGVWPGGHDPCVPPAPIGMPVLPAMPAAASAPPMPIMSIIGSPPAPSSPGAPAAPPLPATSAAPAAAPPDAPAAAPTADVSPPLAVAAPPAPASPASSAITS